MPSSSRGFHDRPADFLIALAGNANVGKSVIFNALTGMNQIVGNWPGKTVELARGRFTHDGKDVEVVDLPGIYSLSTYSQEELVSREFIVSAHPNVVINVVDSTVLQRNLYFTLQLLEIGAPLVIAVNLIDLAEKSGIEIDAGALSQQLGVPVIKCSGASGKGLMELVDAALSAARVSPAPGGADVAVHYGREVEGAIASIGRSLSFLSLGGVAASYPARFIALKLLEGDKEIEEAVRAGGPAADGLRGPAADGLRDPVALAWAIGRRLERIHGHPAATIVASERYAVSARVIDIAVTTKKREKKSPGERLDSFLLKKAGGWIVFVVGMFVVFSGIYFAGDRISSGMDLLFRELQGAFMSLALPAWLSSFIWQGLFQGLIAGVEIALPYIVPFYIVLSILENSGYLSRVAFLTDAIMHRLGLHGKAFIPIILGVGCNVPAVMGTRIMEQPRNRLISAVLATMVPCSARTVVILGLVGVFMGFVPAVSLYVISVALVFLIGRILNRLLPGENPGLIMEMPHLKLPLPVVTLRQIGFRLKDFLVFALPVIAIGSLVLYLLNLAGALTWISNLLAPFTEGFLGLPAITIVVLLFGIFRKELTLIMLAALSHTRMLGSILEPRQIYVFALIVMLYIPCLSTIAVLRREFGTSKTVIISAAEVVGALLLGALVNWGWHLAALLA